MIEVQGTHEKRLTQFLLDCPKQLKGIKGLSASTKKQVEAAEIAAAEAAAAESNSGSSRRTDKPRWERRDKEKEKTFAAEQSAREEHNLRTKGVRRLCKSKNRTQQLDRSNYYTTSLLHFFLLLYFRYFPFGGDFSFQDGAVHTHCSCTKVR